MQLSNANLEWFIVKYHNAICSRYNILYSFRYEVPHHAYTLHDNHEAFVWSIVLRVLYHHDTNSRHVHIGDILAFYLWLNGSIACAKHLRDQSKLLHLYLHIRLLDLQCITLKRKSRWWCQALSPLVVSKVVVMTTSSATSGDKAWHHQRLLGFSVNMIGAAFLLYTEPLTACLVF